MRKTLSLLLTFMLVFSLFSTVVFADETTNQDTQTTNENVTTTSTENDETSTKTEEVTTTTEDEDGADPNIKDEEPEQVIDKSKDVIKDGVHATIRYMDYRDDFYIPKFTLVHRTKEGKTISTVEAGPQNFNKEKGEYNLVFPNPGYKKDEEYQIYLAKKDNSITQLEMVVQYFSEDGESLLTETTTLKTDNYFTFKVRDVAYYEGENNEKAVIDLEPSKLYPLTGRVVTDSANVGFFVVNKNGAPLKNEEIIIQTSDRKTTTIKTDNGGVARIAKNKLTSTFLVYSKTKAVPNSPDGAEIYKYLDRELNLGFKTFTVVLEDKVVQSTSAVDVKVVTEGNTEISKNWINADLAFKDAKGTITNLSVNAKDAKLPLADGTYTVTAKSDYANVKLSSTTINVKNGKANLTVTISPKYTLEVNKGGKAFKFTFMNVDELSNKVVSGSKTLIYGVTPGESYMIQDKEDSKIYTVVIDSNSTVTKLQLGVGVVYGGNATSPHTGDAIVYLVAFLIIALIGAGVTFFIFNKNRRLKNQAMSILLIGALLSGILPLGATPAEASKATGIGSGTPGVTNPGNLTPTGLVQTSEKLSLLQVTFTNGRNTVPNGTGKLNPDSNMQDFMDTYKFIPDRIRNSMFMAPNKEVYDIVNKVSTSYAVFDGDSLVTIYGETPFTGTPKRQSTTGKGAASASENRYAYGIKGTKMSDRLLPLPEDAVKSDGMFEYFMGKTFQRLSSSPNNRQIWTGHKSNSVINVGDIIDRAYVNDFVIDSNEPDIRKKWGKEMSQFALLEDFTYNFLGKLGQEDVINQLNDDINSQDTTDHVFLFQVVQAFYVKGDQSKIMFMPMNDAVEWYLWGRKKENPTRFKDYNPQHEAKVIYNINSDASASNKWAKYAPTHTYTYNVKRTSGIAVKPESNNVKIIRPTSNPNNIRINPFAGWGFVNWGWKPSYTATPKLKAQLKITVTDENGKPTTKVVTHKVPITYKDEKGKEVTTTEGAPLRLVDARKPLTGSMTIKQGSSIYTIPENNESYITLVDEYENEDLANRNFKNDGESLLKFSGFGFDLDEKIKGEEKLKFQMPTNGNKDVWSMRYTLDIPAPMQMNNYLGGNSKETSTKNKFAGRNMYSNALLTIHVTATEDKICENPADCPPPKNSFNVPQWKLSEYYGDISPTKKNKASFSLDIPAVTWENANLSPSGSTTFNLIDPKLDDTPWAISKAKLFNDTPTRTVTPYISSATFTLAGDLLAVKDNGTVGSNKLASWLNRGDLFNKRIDVTAVGVAENKPLVTKNHIFQYAVKSPSSTYTYSETRYRTVCSGSGVDRTCSDVPYTWTGTAPQSYGDTFYDTTVNFHRYVPKDSVANKTFASVKDPKNGFCWETYQDRTKLNVNPEVLMAYDDMSGRTSVVFAAGDKLRSVQPVHYNVAKYVNVDVKPKVDGMSVATDQKAKQLAQTLGAGAVGVVYKGASITTNFEVAGQLELKTYALDIGASALKNAWGNTNYSTTKINEEFLTRYATKQADGTWDVKLQADGKLKINGKEYGGQQGTLNVKQKSANVEEHTLVIRGGKLHSVNGNTNLASLPKDLKDALERMNISTAVGNNVFNTFEREQGDNLTEATVVTQGNALRGTQDLASGKGWYNEDTTVLVVREYTNVYDLPSHMYVDKVPMEVQGLETPMDKNQFFNKGYVGHTKLRYSLVDSFMEYDSSQQTPFGGKFTKDYVVPNVSVLDTFQ